MTNKPSTEGALPNGASRLGVPSSLDSTVISNTEQNEYLSKYKVVQTGKHIEVHIPTLPYRLKRTPRNTQGKKKNFSNRKIEYRKRTVKRTLDVIRRLANGYFNDEYTKHLVLTFADTNQFDISNIEVCNKHFYKFTQKLRKLDSNFKFIKVPEYHKRREAIHYHVMCDVQFIDQSMLQDIWGHGIVFIRKTPVSIARYLYKYLMKNVNDERFIGKRIWSYSRNMLPPQIMYGSKAHNLILRLNNSKAKPTYKFDYYSKYNANIEIYEFIEKDTSAQVTA